MMLRYNNWCCLIFVPTKNYFSKKSSERCLAKGQLWQVFVGASALALASTFYTTSRCQNCGYWHLKSFSMNNSDFALYQQSTRFFPITLMGYRQGSHLPLLLACSQNIMFTWYWKNQRCGGVGWNPPRPSWCDVHVHQSWRNNWWFQRAWEGCYERKPSQT